MSDYFEEIEHTADYALRVQGRHLAELLVNAAHGMNSLLVSDPSALLPELERHFELDAFDAENLLVKWLTEWAYWAEMERLVFNQFDLTDVTETGLKATVRGSRVSNLHKHIKAVTYHNLAITPTDEGLEVTIVFDV